jgi:hypothetical protein
MKLIIISVLFSLSLPAFAQLNEVECEGTYGAKEFILELQQPFPRTSPFYYTLLTVTDTANGTEATYEYTLNAPRRNRGFSKLRYTGAGMTLEIDTWPDHSPRWGRNYLSTLISSDLDNRFIQNVNCRFPNAF